MLDLAQSSRSRLTIKQPIRYILSVLTRVLTGFGNQELYWRLKVADIWMDLLWICHFNKHFYYHPRCPRGRIESAITARWEYQRDSKSLARLGGCGNKAKTIWGRLNTASTSWCCPKSDPRSQSPPPSLLPLYPLGLNVALLPGWDARGGFPCCGRQMIGLPVWLWLAVCVWKPF